MIVRYFPNNFKQDTYYIGTFEDFSEYETITDLRTIYNWRLNNVDIDTGFNVYQFTLKKNVLFAKIFGGNFFTTENKQQKTSPIISRLLQIKENFMLFRMKKIHDSKKNTDVFEFMEKCFSYKDLPCIRRMMIENKQVTIDEFKEHLINIRNMFLVQNDKTHSELSIENDYSSFKITKEWIEEIDIDLLQKRENPELFIQQKSNRSDIDASKSKIKMLGKNIISILCNEYNYKLTFSQFKDIMAGTLKNDLDVESFCSLADILKQKLYRTINNLKKKELDQLPESIFDKNFDGEIPADLLKIGKSLQYRIEFNNVCENYLKEFIYLGNEIKSDKDNKTERGAFILYMNKTLDEIKQVNPTDFFIDGSRTWMPFKKWQLIKVNFFVNERSKTFVNIITNTSSTEGYQKIFNAIDKLHSVKKANIHCDFERAFMNVFSGGNEISPCYFHYKQSLVRWESNFRRKHGLEIQNNINERKREEKNPKDNHVHVFYGIVGKRLMSLASSACFVPKQFQEYYYEQMVKVSHQSLVDKEFLQYMKNTYLMAKYNKILPIRPQRHLTNNISESIFSQLKKSFRYHPNPYNFVRKLIDSQILQHSADPFEDDDIFKTKSNKIVKHTGKDNFDIIINQLYFSQTIEELNYAIEQILKFPLLFTRKNVKNKN